MVKQTVKRHVLVTPAEAFGIGRAVAPHAVRVSLGGASDRACVERGLKILVEVLNKGPQLEQVIM